MSDELLDNILEVFPDALVVAFSGDSNKFLDIYKGTYTHLSTHYLGKYNAYAIGEGFTSYIVTEGSKVVYAVNQTPTTFEFYYD